MKIKSLLYCCINGKKLAKGLNGYYLDSHSDNYYWKKKMVSPMGLNGKIVCECEVETEEIEDRVSYFDSWFNEGHHTKNMTNKELEKRSCLSYQDLCKYLGEGEPNEVVGYVLHLSNVKAFYYPMKLYNVYTRKWIKDEDMYSNETCDSCYSGGCKDCDNHYDLKDVMKPKSIMRVFMSSKEYLLISASPEELCNILNGKADILVRRKVLKGMCD